MPTPTIHGRSYGTGKRKTAIARVFLKPGSGQFVVNGRGLTEYFPRQTAELIIQQPFDIIEQRDQYDIEVNVSGGGLAGQAEAVRHGIARALIVHDPELRGALKRAGFLTRDARKKERKKPGQPGARKKFQYSKR